MLLLVWVHGSIQPEYTAVSDSGCEMAAARTGACAKLTENLAKRHLVTAKRMRATHALALVWVGKAG